MEKQKDKLTKMRITIDKSLANIDLSTTAPEKQAKADETLKRIKLPDTDQKQKHT